MKCLKKPHKKISSPIICANCTRVCELAGKPRSRNKPKYKINPDSIIADLEREESNKQKRLNLLKQLGRKGSD